jgi:hypothetical protein
MACVPSSGIAAGVAQTYPDLEPIEYKLERPIVHASTELNDAAGRYKVNNVTDHNYFTAWCGGGVGNADAEWLAVSFHNKPKRLRPVSAVKIRIIPGYVRSNSLFSENSRPRSAEIEISTSGGAGTTLRKKKIDIMDSPGAQVFKLDLNGSYNLYDLKLTLRFKDVFKGEKYNDMCVSEIEVLPEDAATPTSLHSDGLGAEPRDGDVFMDAPGFGEQPQGAERGPDEIRFTRLLRLDYRDSPDLMFEAVNWMAHSRYFRTAEGEESIKELWLDLYVKYPYQFLRVVELQEKQVRDFIVTNALVRQINDKYNYRVLYLSAVAAKKSGISSAIVAPLVSEFSKNKSKGPGSNISGNLVSSPPRKTQ